MVVVMSFLLALLIAAQAPVVTEVTLEDVLLYDLSWRRVDVGAARAT